MKSSLPRWLLGVSFLLIGSRVRAQDDLMAELNRSLAKDHAPVVATFKGTRLINLHTAETQGKGTLEFRIAHRFGDFSTGSNNLWGLDGPATIQFHLDYSPTDKLTVGVGRASYNKMFDAFVKYKILHQTTDNAIPLTVAVLGSVNVTSNIDPNKTLNGVDRYEFFSNRVAYFGQIMLARKFNSRLSFQLSPLYVHYNMVDLLTDQNDIFALGISGRYKLTGSLALTAEYIYRLNKYSRNFDQYYNGFGIGLDIETGGHVFQLFLTNAIAINEVSVIPYTQSSWSNGQFRLGFNISRVFSVHNHHSSK